jgi:hypothetical protein
MPLIIIDQQFSRNQSEHTNEKNLLQSCLTLHPSEPRLELSRRALLKQLDWEYIFQFAERHALVPLLYHQFKLIGVDSIPSEQLHRFKLGYQANVARSLVLSAELLSLTEGFQSRGIESLPYKGPVLGQIAFGDPALRCFIDLDIIVRPGDVAPAIEILRARGYQPEPDIDARQTQILIASQHSLPFQRDGGHLIVELHWRVSADFFASALDPEYLWRRLEPVTLNNVQLNSLPIEDLLFALCIHASRHAWDRVSQVCDIAALISSHSDIDWEKLMAAARAADAERMLLLGLCLAGEFTEDVLPRDVQHSIAADHGTRRLATQVLARLFAENGGTTLSFPEVFRFNLLVRKSLSARWRYCLFALSPADSDLQTVALPRYLNFTYYGLRPFRLLVSAYRKQKKSPAP